MYSHLTEVYKKWYEVFLHLHFVLICHIVLHRTVAAGCCTVQYKSRTYQGSNIIFLPSFGYKLYSVYGILGRGERHVFWQADMRRMEMKFLKSVFWSFTEKRCLGSHFFLLYSKMPKSARVAKLIIKIAISHSCVIQNRIHNVLPYQSRLIDKHQWKSTMGHA